MNLSRRGFFFGVGATIAVAASGVLMPVKTIIKPRTLMDLLQERIEAAQQQLARDLSSSLWGDDSFFADAFYQARPIDIAGVPMEDGAHVNAGGSVCPMTV